MKISSENRFSGKTYLYTIASSPRRAGAVPQGVLQHAAAVRPKHRRHLRQVSGTKLRQSEKYVKKPEQGTEASYLSQGFVMFFHLRGPA